MKISVVIPAHNEERYIKRTLESIQKQTHKPYEVIVVDNNSTDKTGGIAKKMGVKVLYEKNKGCGFARKAGFEAAKGDIIATTDADSILPAYWIYRINKAFLKDPDAIAVGGPYRFDTNKYRIIQKIVAGIWVFFDKILNAGNNLPGVNMAVKKNAYKETGGFKKNLNFEDLDLSLRLKKHGKVIFLKNLVVLTSFRRYNEKGAFKTTFNYMKNYLKVRFGKGNVYMEDIRETK